ncbi:hypothetical protein VNO77_22581 [Canavalia gladiata]|uniref:Uncharacterized protein n=1 Tax=Canavalia gladiata TaxID=3824 RepID=A0AAN9QB49_CANGL
MFSCLEHWHAKLLLRKGQHTYAPPKQTYVFSFFFPTILTITFHNTIAKTSPDKGIGSITKARAKKLQKEVKALLSS